MFLSSYFKFRCCLFSHGNVVNLDMLDLFSDLNTLTAVSCFNQSFVYWCHHTVGMISS